MALSLLRRDQPQTPSPAVKLVEDRLQIAKDDRREAEQRWALNLAFYEGRQWVYYNKATNRVQVPPAPPWRVRHTANYITPMVYTLLAKLSKKRPNIDAVPATGDEEDINAARKSTQLLEYLWGELNLTEKRYQLMLWVLITGQAFLKVYWDKSAGGEITKKRSEIEQLPHGVIEADETITFHLGDVCVEVVSPYELGVDPSAGTIGSLDGAGWVTHEKVRSVEEIESEYGVRVPPEDVSGEAIVEASRAGMTGGDDRPSGGTGKRLNHHAVVKELWQRATPDYPDGRYIVVASGQQLYDGPLPYVDADGERDLPFVEFSHVIVPGKFWRRSLVEDLIGPQKGINVSISKLMEIQNLMAMPKIIVQEGSMDPGKWTSEPGQQVLVRGGVPPQIWAPQVFPQGVFELVNLHLETMYKLSGVREFSLSGAPSGAHSGVALNLLMEQDETRLGPVIDLMENGLARVGAKMLQLVQGDGTDQSPYGYMEPRTIRVTGRGGLIETLDFTASDVKFADVKVEAGSSLPKSKAAQQQFILELVGAGILNPERDQDRILKLLDIGSVEPEVDEAMRDELFAELENRRMAAEQPQMAHPWEDHAVHIREHNAYRKRDAYETLPPEVQMLFEQHVEQHKALMVAVEQEHALMALVPQITVARAEAQAAAAAQAEAAGPLGGAPPGSIPPRGPTEPPPGGAGLPLPTPGAPGIRPPPPGVPAA